MRAAAEVAPRAAAAREHAALDRQPGVLRRAEHAHARHRVVARQDHDLDALTASVVEGEQLVHQREGDAGLRRLLQPLQLQSHVSAIVAGLEDRFSSSKSNRARERDRDDQLLDRVSQAIESVAWLAHRPPPYLIHGAPHARRSVRRRCGCLFEHALIAACARSAAPALHETPRAVSSPW